MDTENAPAVEPASTCDHCGRPGCDGYCAEPSCAICGSVDCAACPHCGERDCSGHFSCDCGQHDDGDGPLGLTALYYRGGA